jgi:hypothetical protein
MLRAPASSFNWLYTHRGTGWEVLAKEVVGINAPKIAVTRDQDERIDVAVNEVGNTLGYFGGGWALNHAADVLLRDVAKTHPERFVLGKSIALFAPLTAFMWGMPFLRNYVTAARIGVSDFARIIGKGTQAESASGNPASKSPNDYLRTFATAMAVGAGIGLAGLGWTRMAQTIKPAGQLLDVTIRGLQSIRNIPELWLYGKRSRNLFEHLTLGSGHVDSKGFMSGMNDTHAMLFWGAPAYAGWYCAARDQHERRETAIKFGTFTASFFAVPALAEHLLEKGLKLGPKTVYGAKFGSALTALAGTLFFNIWLTNRKVAPPATSLPSTLPPQFANVTVGARATLPVPILQKGTTPSVLPTPATQAALPAPATQIGLGGLPYVRGGLSYPLLQPTSWAPPSPWVMSQPQWQTSLFWLYNVAPYAATPPVTLAFTPNAPAVVPSNWRSV